MEEINRIHLHIAPLRQQLLEHPVYRQMNSLPELRIFMEHHIYAVWDFMSLLKALQQQLTCISVPWIPKGNKIARQLINEIVLDEESDVDIQGMPASHFELYLEAMQAAGADTSAIQQLLRHVEVKGLYTALAEAGLPAAVEQFLHFTFEVIESGEPHKIAAVFTFGREDLIPDMFEAIVQDISQEYPQELILFNYYLERHIELDSGEHGPKAMQMIEALCKGEPDKWKECAGFAYKALEHRLQLWDGILDAMN